MLNVALNPRFCKTFVIGSGSFSVVLMSVGLLALLHFCLALCCWKNANVLTIDWKFYILFSVISLLSLFCCTNNFVKAFTTFHIKTGGTALPIARYCLLSETLSNLNVVGKD